jgi:dolichol-phosphate mannosyltransferase
VQGSAGLSGIRAKISRFANFVGRTLLGITVSDPMSGYFAIRRDVVDKVASEISGGFKV